MSKRGSSDESRVYFRFRRCKDDGDVSHIVLLSEENRSTSSAPPPPQQYLHRKDENSRIIFGQKQEELEEGTHHQQHLQKQYYPFSFAVQILKDLFLPVGYPDTVNNGREYIQYQFYDSLQGLCSYLRGVVCTSAVLTAAGVGDSEATALSAAVVSLFLIFRERRKRYFV